MSLLEDVFLEDEAGEAQELERVIEGDEFDERPRSRSDSDENSAKEDEAEEDKRRVDPTSAKPKRIIKNPRFVLNPARLTGPRGIQVVTEHFKDFRFKGKGHEKDDLDLILKKLEHWAYRLYPKFQFQDCLKKIETLGKKRAVSVNLHKIRMDMITSEETVVQKDSSDDEAPPAQEPEEDEFDKLLQQQIEIARATPAPSSVKKTPFSERSSMMPKATSSPSINDEQRERMLNNRRMAEERRLARLKNLSTLNSSQENVIENNVPQSPTKTDVNSIEKKQTSVIDNSDQDVISKSDNGGNKTVTDNSDKNVTINLDNDDMVVTKSPKCYVPAKKHKSKIDDSEGDTITKSITIDNINDIVELDNNGQVISRPPKKLNISRIVSSDDDVSETITVDVDKHNTIPSKSISNKNKSVTDSSDDENLVINEPVTVDVENNYSNNKKYKSNVIDSSDSEDEAVAMNESITVDIHDSNTHVTNESNKNISHENNKHVTDNSNKLDNNKDNLFDSLLKDTVENNNGIMEYSNIENQSNIAQNLTRSTNVSNSLSYDNYNNNPKINNKTEALTEKTIANVSETELTDKTEERNVSELENDDEIMNVDFSDDI